MENTEVTRAPRFKNLDNEVIYDLFDAFVKATLVDDRAIDFSKPVTVSEDGSRVFATRDEKFSDIISSDFKVQVVKAPRKPVKPSMPKKPKDSENHEKMRKYEAARAMFSQEKYDAQMKEYQTQLERYEAEVAEAVRKRADLLRSKGLLYAHLNWLWTLGMNNAKTSCGADNLKSLDIEKEEGDAFTGKNGLWKASSGSMQKEQSFICNVLFRFATTNPAIKAMFNTVADVKQCLVDIVWKVKASEKINARHGLLHFCDPDNYSALYSTEEKVHVVDDHRGSLVGFMDPYNRCDVVNSLYYRDEKLGYRYPTTDAQICYLVDENKVDVKNLGKKEEKEKKLQE